MTLIAKFGTGLAGGLLTIGLFTAPGAGASTSTAGESDSTASESTAVAITADDQGGAPPGDSHTQGRSSSDPDGDDNGGADKPTSEGGVDADDRDGNNGCGNDDDFEDDNNGRCLGRLKHAEASGEEDGAGSSESEEQMKDGAAQGDGDSDESTNDDDATEDESTDDDTTADTGDSDDTTETGDSGAGSILDVDADADVSSGGIAVGGGLLAGLFPLFSFVRKLLMGA